MRWGPISVTVIWYPASDCITLQCHLIVYRQMQSTVVISIVSTTQATCRLPLNRTH